MILEITDYFGTPVKLQPRVELYSVRDFMGGKCPALPLFWTKLWESPMRWNLTQH